MKYKVKKYFMGGKYPIGSIVDESNLINQYNIAEKVKEDCIEPYFETKMVIPIENKMIKPNENKDYKIELN